MAEASLFCGLYGTAEAVPHKDLEVATWTHQPVGFRLIARNQAQQAEAREHRPQIPCSEGARRHAVFGVA